MGLKCFNRHGLYDVATLRIAQNIHLSGGIAVPRAPTLSFRGAAERRRSSISDGALAGNCT